MLLFSHETGFSACHVEVSLEIARTRTSTVYQTHVGVGGDVVDVST